MGPLLPYCDKGGRRSSPQNVNVSTNNGARLQSYHRSRRAECSACAFLVPTLVHLFCVQTRIQGQPLSSKIAGVPGFVCPRTTSTPSTDQPRAQKPGQIPAPSLWFLPCPRTWRFLLAERYVRAWIGSVLFCLHMSNFVLISKNRFAAPDPSLRLPRNNKYAFILSRTPCVFNREPGGDQAAL